MLYAVVLPSSIVDWRRLVAVRAYCRTRIGPVTETRACVQSGPCRPPAADVHGESDRPPESSRCTSAARRRGDRRRHAPSRQAIMDGCTVHASRARPSVRQAGACTAYNACNAYNADNAYHDYNAYNA